MQILSCVTSLTERASEMKQMILIVLAVYCVATMPTAIAADAKVGIVILHGKLAPPNNNVISPLTIALEREGVQVSNPEMPWSKSRQYNKNYAGAIAELDGAVTELKKKGAEKIFVAGHSFGANIALNYATQSKIAGVLALSPGQIPQHPDFAKFVKEDLAKAKKLIGEGRGEETQRFADVDLNAGGTFTTVMSAKNYVSYFDPDGSANMEISAASIKPGTPLLVVTANRELAPLKDVGNKIFARAPSHPGSKHLIIDSTHLKVPTDAAREIVAWIKALQ